MKIPESIDLEDQEVITFLRELVDVARCTRANAEALLRAWEQIQMDKRINPHYWSINK